MTLDEYRDYLYSNGFYLHHFATCRPYENGFIDDYVAQFYSGRFGEGMKIIRRNPVTDRFLLVEYWIKE